MKIKAGDKLPNSELFYLDLNNEVKKIDTLNLLLILTQQQGLQLQDK